MAWRKYKLAHQPAESWQTSGGVVAAATMKAGVWLAQSWREMA
jgi:hypothetical protein